VPIDVDLGSISIPTNRVLQIRVTVGTASSDAMMLAYDTTAYPVPRYSRLGAPAG
jgi:hypothetical protein